MKESTLAAASLHRSTRTPPSRNPPREARFVAVQTVQVGDQSLDAAMRRRILERPIDRCRPPEFAALAEFAAHEKQLLAGMREHVAEKQPQIREFLPSSPGIFSSSERLP